LKNHLPYARADASKDRPFISQPPTAYRVRYQTMTHILGTRMLGLTILDVDRG
jgi:hypothetical protein